jgi:hypothetical protein
MKSSGHQRLLREILADEKVEQLRANSLGRMLAVARQRRRRRIVLSGVGASLVIAMTAMVSMQRASRDPSLARSPIRPAATHRVDESPAAPLALAKSGSVKVLDDEQLLALFSERSVALIGRPGEQQLVFLDDAISAHAPMKKP